MKVSFVLQTLLFLQQSEVSFAFVASRVSSKGVSFSNNKIPLLKTFSAVSSVCLSCILVVLEAEDLFLRSKVSTDFVFRFALQTNSILAWNRAAVLMK